MSMPKTLGAILLGGLCGVLSAPSAALTLNEVAKLLASDGAFDDQFGVSVAVSGNTAVIGAFRDEDNGPASGSAYLFVRSGGVWSQQAKLLPSDGAAFDQFGFSVAVSGNTAVIGAWGDGDNGSASGSAYLFVRSGGVWSQQAKLLPSDGAAFDRFGFAVAVSGNTAVIGAFLDDDNGFNSGSAYVFDLTGATATINEEAKLLASDGAAFDFFGRSVAVSGDAAVIGAASDDDNGSGSGSAYVFDLTGATGTINEAAKLLASDGAAGDEFGRSVAVSGAAAVISARFDDDNGTSSGSAYVFDLTGATGIVNEAAKLLASDADAGDLFGSSVAVSGNTALIGAPGDDDNPFFVPDVGDTGESGSAYFFDLTGATGTVNEAAKLLASDAFPDDFFGFSVAVSGNTALIGAIGDDDNGFESGSAYVFSLVSAGFVTGGGWIDSPPGAYVADPSVSGKANFGFVSRHQKVQNTPTGNTRFQFQAADLNFRSDTHESLVIAGPSAQYQGVGTINGAGNFGFMVSVIDAALTDITDVDLFRIRIWNKDAGDAVVYDNEIGAGEGAAPTTEIGGGSIKIHSKDN